MNNTISCAKCGSPAKLRYKAKDYNKKMSNLVFDYYRCETCHYIFLDPVPADLGKYYPTSYYEVPKDQGELAEVAEKLQQWKLDTLLRFGKGGRLLEIGPAYGLFSFLAKRAGFDVTGIEMDARCSAFLRDVVGITVVNTDDVVTAMKALPKFDVIVMWQVIEHLPDPWAALTAAADNLAPDGILILDTPNPDAFQFKVLGHRWAHLDAPRHVTLIPAALMTTHLEAHGMKPDLLTADDVSARGFNGFGWAYSFMHLFGDNPLGKLAHFSGRVLAKLLIPIERTGWRGSTYTAVFRKQA